MTEREIYCCGCGSQSRAKLTSGREIYPHRPDLYSLPFWQCPACGNYVGCHHKTKDRTRPLGVIPTKEIRRARQEIHALIDPVWKSRRLSRREVYEKLARALGTKEFHSAEIRSVGEAKEVLAAARRVF